jgi:SAM-dependent methyltransferase
MINFIKNYISAFLEKHGRQIIRLLPARPLHKSRFDYQKKYIDFTIDKNARILDIGSGGDPFPYATVLAERFLEPSRHRTSAFRSDQKPVVICDIQRLPFKDKSFDYVYCSHVLEHVDDPILACREIMRVGNKGYIESPHFMTDALFAWADGMHKWFIQSQGNRLVFFEYDKRRLEGIRSAAWRNAVFGPYYNEFQDVFADNSDIFMVMFPWDKRFSVDVYYLNGDVRHGD